MEKLKQNSYIYIHLHFKFGLFQLPQSSHHIVLCLVEKKHL